MVGLLKPNAYSLRLKQFQKIFHYSPLYGLKSKPQFIRLEAFRRSYFHARGRPSFDQSN